MDSVYLDSSVIIECLRNNPKITKIVDSFSGLVVSGYIVMAELYESVYLSKNIETKDQLEEFFEGLDQIHGINKQISNQFGRIRANLRKRGLMIEDVDILIAATCIVNNLELYTLNKKHFRRINGLNLVDDGIPQN